MLDLLRAYVEETSDHPEDNVVSFDVVGLIGPVHEWHKLQSKWEDALECCQVHRFHGTDLGSLERDYKGWTPYQRERLISLLVRVVQESMSNLRLIGANTVMKDFRDLPEGRKMAARDPYFLGVVWTMLQATWKAEEEFGGLPVEIIFDQKHKQVATLNDAYDQVLSTKVGHLLAGFTRGNHRFVSPIQVADLTAYESKKYLDAKLENKNPIDLRWPLKQLEDLFFGSKAALFNTHGLMLATDFEGDYQRMRESFGGKRNEVHRDEVHRKERQ